MSFPQWRLAGVTAPPAPEQDGYTLEDVEERARALAAVLGWEYFCALVKVLKKSRDPEMQLDVAKCLTHRNDTEDKFLADYSRKWNVTPATWHERILAMARKLGVPYTRRKVKGRRLDRGNLAPRSMT